MDIAYLSIKGVTKYYKNHKAVDSVDLEIQRGTFLTILGPSGSGKTTLLKLIAGFEELSSGSIFLDDIDLSGKAPEEREIGMVFQNYALFPHMTVEQNVAYPLKIRKVPKKEIKQKVMDILELVNLSGFEDRKPKELSGGQQQRVALARAIVFNPPLLLLDEPLGALDKNLRERMQFEIRRIQKEIGITTINVTHDQEEALTMSDVICVMNQGKVEQIATPEELYEKPVNKFVANFIGEVNLLGGRYRSLNEQSGEVRLFNGDNHSINVNHEKEFFNKDVYVVLRPEHIFVINENEAQYDNVFDVIVEEKVFIGDAVKLKCKTSFSEDLIIKSHANNAKALKIGQKIKIGWKQENTSIIAYE